MIKGMHGMFYSDKAVELREFLRDKLEFKATDVGEGWLIFDLPVADLGVHPTDDSTPTGTHDISFFCDDIESTVVKLKDKGVEFLNLIEDHGYGFVTYFKMPGVDRVQLYQPKYKK